jgi:hypothetical protein
MKKKAAAWDLRTLTPEQKLNTMHILHRLMGTTDFTEAFISTVSTPTTEYPNGASVRVRITYPNPPPGRKKKAG